MQLLKDLGERLGIPVLVNMHDVELAKRFAVRIIGMSDGKIVYDDSPKNLSDHILQEIYGGEDWLQ